MLLIIILQPWETNWLESYREMCLPLAILVITQHSICCKLLPTKLKISNIIRILTDNKAPCLDKIGPKLLN